MAFGLFRELEQSASRDERAASHSAHEQLDPGIIARDPMHREMGGPTAEWNLVRLCRGHHGVKTFGRWAYQPGPLGELVVTTDTGNPFRTRPRVMLARAREDTLATVRQRERDRVSPLTAADGHLTNPPGAFRRSA